MEIFDGGIANEIQLLATTFGSRLFADDVLTFDLLPNFF
jgi:hypothetical protein